MRLDFLESWICDGLIITPDFDKLKELEFLDNNFDKQAFEILIKTISLSNRVEFGSGEGSHHSVHFKKVFPTAKLVENFAHMKDKDFYVNQFRRLHESILEIDKVRL